MTAPNNPLPDRYYLSNFVKLVTHVSEYYTDLLLPSEKAWIDQFSTLENSEKCCLIRLLTRKGCWFRSDKFHYPEIENIPGALATLEKLRFIELNPPIDAAQLAQHILTKPESIAFWPTLPQGLCKAALIKELSHSERYPRIACPFDVICLLDDSILTVLCTLFFANGHQDFSQFVLEDLGINRFENYPLEHRHRFFTSRHELNSLLALNALSATMSDSDLKNTAVIDALAGQIPALTGHGHVDRKREKLINALARAYERAGCDEQALSLFQLTALPPSKERRIRILEKQNRDELAWSLVLEILASPQNISEYEVAETLQRKLIRKSGTKPERVKFSPPERRIALDLSQKRVECAVADDLTKQGWQVFYLENHFLNALFGLAFWDIIFAPVEGSFINAYQSQPLDMYHESFYAKRRSLIEARLDIIKGEGIKPFLSLCSTKQGICNPFVYWPAIDIAWLNLAADHLNGPLLYEIFNIMLKDLKQYRTGMPDLIAFKDEQLLWCEVKGPGDKLQDNQKRWMRQFERLNIPYEVCYVENQSTTCLY